MALGMDKIEDVSPEAVTQMLDTNVKGVVHFIQAVLPGMRARNKGHIINIGSVAGIQTYVNGGMYCASKHALDAITRILLLELVDTPIRVSEVKPGNVCVINGRLGGDRVL